MLATNSLIALLGLAQGITVGTAFAAFIVFLDLVYRLIQVTSTSKHLKIYQNTLIIAFSLFAFLDLFDYKLNLGLFAVILIGLTMGIFIGMLASALAEVLNVIPVLVKRLDGEKYIGYIIISIMAGKVIGSLIYWLKIN